MPNQYVNKVQQSNGTVLIDITDTTAVASDVATGKYFYLATGEKVEGTSSGGGGGGSVVVTEEANATGITCVITTSSEPTPSETWETLYDGAPTVNPDTPYNLFWISELTDVYPTAGSEWRITVDSVEYRCTATLASTSIGNTVCIGNPKYTGGQDDGSNAPFSFYNAGWGALVGDTELSAGAHMLKIERLVTS